MTYLNVSQPPPYPPLPLPPLSTPHSSTKVTADAAAPIKAHMAKEHIARGADGLRDDALKSRCRAKPKFAPPSLREVPLR